MAPAAPAPVAAAGGNAGQLMLQVQQLQQEVMRLNGVVEEQAHELRTLKSQSLERYLDIDRRLSLLAGGSVDGAELPAAGPAAVDSAAAPAPRPEAAGAAGTTEQPGEAAA
ncbi:MAG TPA: tol-pal system protein YbgF, partial [Haliea salexigens]|nr:tol-pal system protein YbgF [Haliea salexigens]